MQSSSRLAVVLTAALAWILLSALAQRPPPDFYCRDPDLGGQIPANMKNKRRFLLIGGGGAGIGNFLIYYPSAYYFALFTGRDILIIDDSLIGEMCTVLTCGYPFYSQVQTAFPKLLLQPVSAVKNGKIWDFMRYFNNEITLDEVVMQSIGSKLQSGWYMGYNYTKDCITRITGCAHEDIMCHDRHALQRLVRGPFKQSLTESEEKRIIGVPLNLKHAIMSLPHAFSPRLDAAIHLRTQFTHFERLIGPEDPGWAAAYKEQMDWLNCTSSECGNQLFAVLERKIMEELPAIRGRAEAQRQSMRRWRRLANATAFAEERNNSEIEKELYSGEDGEKIYIYLASDNALVKEAFARYLIGHANIAVMRVKNNAQIVHAKNMGYLRGAGNNTGVMDLVLDWYALSLANVVFAWRKGTTFISTFTHSAQRLSGNNEHSNHSAGIGHGIGSRGLSLYFIKGAPAWRHFY